MKLKLFILSGMLLSSSVVQAIPMPCENLCCEKECTSTETSTKRWVETSSQRWVDYELDEEIEIKEESTEEKVEKKISKVVPRQPTIPRVKQRKCTDSKVYDYFFFNAHMRGGNYGGAYVLGWQMNDQFGMVIRCPDPVSNTSGGSTSGRNSGGSVIQDTDPEGYWATDYSGYYVYDTSFSEECTWRDDCSHCERPPAVPEPATMLLFGTGMLCLANVFRGRRK